METRLAFDTDAHLLAVLHALCFKEEAPWSAEQLRSCLTLSTTRAWLTSHEDDLLGFIIYQKIASESEILTFCVHPKARRCHIGQDLLDYTMTFLFGQSVKRIFLEVAADNQEALALYTKKAFKIQGRRKDYYKRGSTRTDALTLVYQDEL